ncbi:MAG3240 family lipoprotein [Mycoplasmopsis opalescens]|uniref:MAG3240 family lipoprotein n=1 Tax=Mycoplasmopsis opalescens TaxID=114886 RepID=UPI0004A78543|nr:hypothetical protein [Mycoplasmopsis opalescens]
MRTKFKLYLSALPLGSMCLISAISCNQQAKKDVYLDLEKTSRVFLNRLTLSQIATIEKDNHIFYHFDNGFKEQFNDVKIEDNKLWLLRGSKWIHYVPDFPYRKNWKQFETENKNIRIFDSEERSDINNFLREYNFELIDSAGNYNDEWFNNLSLVWGKDFNRQRDPYFEDLQTIIFRINQDIYLNYGLMNRKYLVNAKKERYLFTNWIQPQYLQATAFLNNDNESLRKTFTELLKLYLNKFNVNVAKITVDWEDSEIKKSFSSNTKYVAFKIKSILDWNNNELMDQKYKENKYYINGFRNYAINGKFGVGTKGLIEKLPLFTDYIENPLLLINGKEYLSVVDNINHFIKPATSIDYWNSKGLMNLFSLFKDEILEIKVPKYRENEDLKYKIIDFEFTNYFDSNQIFRAIVEVNKKDGTKKKYAWLSSNFDDHGHRLKGLITKNKPPKDLIPDDIYSFKPHNTGIDKGIKLEDFVSDDINGAFMEALKNASDKLSLLFGYWNNDSRQNFDVNLLNNESYQIKIFNAYLNNYLLAYALENVKNQTLSGVKRIDINLKPELNKLGQLYFELNFIGFENPLDFKYYSKGEKTIAKASLYWNFFKGYDAFNSDHLFDLIEFRREK